MLSPSMIRDQLEELIKDLYTEKAKATGTNGEKLYQDRLDFLTKWADMYDNHYDAIGCDCMEHEVLYLCAGYRTDVGTRKEWEDKMIDAIFKEYLATQADTTFDISEIGGSDFHQYLQDALDVLLRPATVDDVEAGERLTREVGGCR